MTLKQKNIPVLISVLLLNAAAVYVLLAWPMSSNELSLTSGEYLERLVGLGLMVPIVTLLNGLVPSSWKHRLVFLRWRHVLPGHRAFSRIIRKDERFDPDDVAAKLGPLPEEPGKQNALVYRWSKLNSGDGAINDAHQNFLLFRDWAVMSVLMLITVTPAIAIVIGSIEGLIVGAILFVEFNLVRLAASVAGDRWVGTVVSCQLNAQTD